MRIVGTQESSGHFEMEFPEQLAGDVLERLIQKHPHSGHPSGSLCFPQHHLPHRGILGAGLRPTESDQQGLLGAVLGFPPGRFTVDLPLRWKQIQQRPQHALRDLQVALSPLEARALDQHLPRALHRGMLQRGKHRSYPVHIPDPLQRLHQSQQQPLVIRTTLQGAAADPGAAVQVPELFMQLESLQPHLGAVPLELGRGSYGGLGHLDIPCLAGGIRQLRAHLPSVLGGGPGERLETLAKWKIFAHDSRSQQRWPWGIILTVGHNMDRMLHLSDCLSVPPR
mmetsp:Transcript_40652/g.97447  ORF Transcript_40652/g.97447 Transcript_40652/m.97447 type:complete len:282 (-) Transcript_40652:274-1119(-)